MLGTASLFLAASGWTILAFARANLLWGSTTGVVVSSGVGKVPSSEGGETYRPEVSYRYQVDGSSYLSDGFGIGLQHHATSTGSEESAQDWVNRHPVGSKIIAYYEKTDPQTSAIDLRPDAFVALLALFPVPHFFVGLAMTLGSFNGPGKGWSRSGLFLKMVGAWGVVVAGTFTALHALTWISGTLFATYFLILIAVVLERRKRLVGMST